MRSPACALCGEWAQHFSRLLPGGSLPIAAGLNPRAGRRSPLVCLLSLADAHLWPTQGVIEVVDKRTNDPVAGIAQTLVVRSPRLARRARTAAIAVVAVGGIAVLANWLHDRFTHVYVSDARIAADLIAVATRVPGLITAVDASAGDRIDSGQLLVTLDSRDAVLSLAELEARLAALTAERARLEATITMVDRETRSRGEAERARLAAAKANLVGRQNDLQFARVEFERAQSLRDSRVISQQRWEEIRNREQRARQEQERSQADVAQAEAALLEAEAGRGRVEVLQRELAALRPREQEVTAQRDRQRLTIDNHRIVSPTHGVIDRIFVNPGEYVAGGQRLLLIHDPDTIWVDANVKETEIRHLRLGAPAHVSVDAYPDLEFMGEVVRIGSAATNQFALLPNPNPSGNFTKIAQRLPVRIAVRQKDGLLRPGMMVEVRLDLDR
ncbi:MAG: HlyD family secretion protein [Alphaproteobacteria bacterium]|nr:HlyD family secretion protein [Alphaproteobacteria bacterium]